MERYSEYNPFARTYNRHWGDNFIFLVLPLLEKYLFPHIPTEAKILDLCCGTGNLARQITGKGYSVTGIDGSEEMLRYAAENAPDAELVLADARNFSLPPVYSAAVSVFDSLNHVMSEEDLTSVFRNVYKSLSNGGLFLFDLNMAAGFSTNWHDEFSIIEDDEVCIVRSNYNPDTRTAVFEAVIFNNDDGWKRTDITLYQRCYTEQEIIGSLKKAGFGEVNSYSCDIFSDLIELKEDSERAFFIARKTGAKSRAEQKR